MPEPERNFEEWVSYPGEKIHWKNCTAPDDEISFECGMIGVPMDQFNHTRSKKKFGIPLIRSRGKDGSPNILFAVL